MRTTLTLDADLVKKLKALAQRQGQSFTHTLNEVVRRGLAAPARERRERYVVVPHHGGFRPGIDLAKLNQLVDQLEVDDLAGEAEAARR